MITHQDWINKITTEDAKPPESRTDVWNGPRLSYADWLESQGDPRANVLRLMHSRGRREQHWKAAPALPKERRMSPRRAVEELVSIHRGEWESTAEGRWLLRDTEKHMAIDGSNINALGVAILGGSRRITLMFDETYADKNPETIRSCGDQIHAIRNFLSSEQLQQLGVQPDNPVRISIEFLGVMDLKYGVTHDDWPSFVHANNDLYVFERMSSVHIPANNSTVPDRMLNPWVINGALFVGSIAEAPERLENGVGCLELSDVTMGNFEEGPGNERLFVVESFACSEESLFQFTDSLTENEGSIIIRNLDLKPSHGYETDTWDAILQMCAEGSVLLPNGITLHDYPIDSLEYRIDTARQYGIGVVARYTNETIDFTQGYASGEIMAYVEGVTAMEFSFDMEDSDNDSTIRDALEIYSTKTRNLKIAFGTHVPSSIEALERINAAFDGIDFGALQELSLQNSMLRINELIDILGRFKKLELLNLTACCLFEEDVTTLSETELLKPNRISKIDVRGNPFINTAQCYRQLLSARGIKYVDNIPDEKLVQELLSAKVFVDGIRKVKTDEYQTHRTICVAPKTENDPQSISAEYTDGVEGRVPLYANVASNGGEEARRSWQVVSHHSSLTSVRLTLDTTEYELDENGLEHFCHETMPNIRHISFEGSDILIDEVILILEQFPITLDSVSLRHCDLDTEDVKMLAEKGLLSRTRMTRVDLRDNPYVTDHECYLLMAQARGLSLNPETDRDQIVTILRSAGVQVDDLPDT